MDLTSIRHALNSFTVLKIFGSSTKILIVQIRCKIEFTFDLYHDLFITPNLFCRYFILSLCLYPKSTTKFKLNTIVVQITQVQKEGMSLPGDLETSLRLGGTGPVEVRVFGDLM